MNPVRHLPNAITLSNLALGVLSITCSTRHDLFWAAAFIAVATIPDFLDGLVARLLKVSSKVGKDLDSLADLVSFGVAPAIMIFKLEEQFLEPGYKWVSFLTLCIPIAAAIRLAKFNNDERQVEDFYGLTTTATALWLSSWPFLIEFDRFLPDSVFTSTLTFALIPVLASAMMLMNLRLFSLKFKNLKWSENRIRFGFLVLCVGYVALFGFLGATLIIFTYLVLSVIRNFAE